MKIRLIILILMISAVVYAQQNPTKETRDIHFTVSSELGIVDAVATVEFKATPSGNKLFPIKYEAVVTQVRSINITMDSYSGLSATILHKMLADNKVQNISQNMKLSIIGYSWPIKCSAKL